MGSSNQENRCEFKYDVAITLVGKDESFARKLESKIREVVRGEVFLYSRRQENLAAGGELVDTFTGVFRDQARVVLILHRPEWGKTPYTSIEQDAIKGRRATSTDLRWVVVVSMEPPHLPDWYPASEFWLKRETFNPEKIAGVIASRVHEAGGTVGNEDPLERMERLQREQEKRDEIATRLKRDGPERMKKAVGQLFTLFEERAEELSEAGNESMGYEEDRRHRACAINYRWPSLIVEWDRRYSNT